MQKIKLAVICALMVFITGCATPIGIMTDSDFVWHDKVVNLPAEKVYRNMFAGFRACGGVAAEPFVDGDISQIVLYLRNVSSVTQFVFGTVKLKEIEKEKTLVRVGIQPKYDSPLFGEDGQAGALFLTFTNEINKDCTAKI